MVGHLLRDLQLTSIEQVLRDAGAPEQAVAAAVLRSPGSRGWAWRSQVDSSNAIPNAMHSLLLPVSERGLSGLHL